RKRFEVLLQQAELPSEWMDKHFRDGHINKVEISRSRKEWTFHISKSTLLPKAIYVGFIERVRTKLGHIADIKKVLLYEQSISTQSIVQEYWSVFVEWMQQEVVSVNGWL